MSNNTIEHYEWRNSQQKDSKALVKCVIREGITQSRQAAHQAHWSFLSSIVISTTSTAIGLVGASLLLLGHASEGSVTAAVGIVSGVYSHQLSKDAADRQQQANERLDNMLQELHTLKGGS